MVILQHYNIQDEKQPKCLLTDEENVVHAYIGIGIHPFIKRKKFYNIVILNLENVILSEISETRK